MRVRVSACVCTNVKITQTDNLTCVLVVRLNLAAIIGILSDTEKPIVFHLCSSVRFWLDFLSLYCALLSNKPKNTLSITSVFVECDLTTGFYLVVGRTTLSLWIHALTSAACMKY